MKRKRNWKLVLLGVLMLPVLIWLGSLIRCEILTAIHYDQFEYAYQNNTMLGEMEYFKVLKYTGDTAEVYYVERDMTSGNVLKFRRSSDAWVESAWNCVWSTSGSASDVIYPYWWHFIYGGL